MLILLPPSETKAHGGDGPSLSELGGRVNCPFPEVRATSERLVRAIEHMGSYRSAKTRARSRSLLGLKDTQDSELDYNARVRTSPTSPAIERYTGVAYEALDATGSRTGISLGQPAIRRIAMGSALWGVVGAAEQIPYYRLSAGSKLLFPRRQQAVTLKNIWGSSITHALEEWCETMEEGGDAIFDFRSSGYAALGKIQGAVQLRVETEYPNGTRKVVSHFNKYYKGLAARELALLEDDIGAADAGDALAEVINHSPTFRGETIRAEPTSNRGVTMIVPAAQQKKATELP